MTSFPMLNFSIIPIWHYLSCEMIRKDRTSFSWSMSDFVSEVRLVFEWSLVLIMSACSFSESFSSFFLPMALYFWINTEAFVLDLSDSIEGCQERVSQIQVWQPLVCGLLNFCIGFSVEQNDSDFMEIMLLLFFCSFIIPASWIGDLLSSILWMFPAFQWP